MFTIDNRNPTSLTTGEHKIHSKRLQQTAPTQRVTDSTLPNERRRRPERRRSRLPEYQGNERRRRSDRRMPKLLSAKDGKPEALESRKGGLINTAI